jgi:hypothetical protein
MKALINEIQLPLPGAPERATTLPALKADREPQSSMSADLSKLSAEGRTMVDWIGCLSRGRHDFDEEGVCVDCTIKRTP